MLLLNPFPSRSLLLLSLHTTLPPGNLARNVTSQNISSGNLEINIASKNIPPGNLARNITFQNMPGKKYCILKYSSRQPGPARNISKLMLAPKYCPNISSISINLRSHKYFFLRWNFMYFYLVFFTATSCV